MADVVTRLVVESKEYDSKIARATQGLTQFEKKCREAGGTLEYVEKEDLDFVKALGQMETVSSSATGKLGELKKAFTELSVQYKNLTDAEKQSPYGQALSASLDQIKGRIGTLSTQLGEANGELNISGTAFEKFAGKLGVPKAALGEIGSAMGRLGPIAGAAGKAMIGALGPVGVAIAAVTAALKVLKATLEQVKDAFKRNEDAMAAVQKIAAPFKAIWQIIQRLLDDLVSTFTAVYANIERAAGGFDGFYVALKPIAAVLAAIRAAIAVVGTVLKDITKAIAIVSEKVREAVRSSVVGDFFRNIKETIEGFFVTLTDWIASIANSKLGKMLGLDELHMQLKEIANAQDELTKKNKQIADSERDLKALRRSTQEANARSEMEIAKLREEASEKYKYSAKQRLAMLEQAAKLEEENMQRNVDLKQKELDLIKLKNSLTKSGTEDLQAQSDAEVALIQAQTEFYNKKRALQRQIQAAMNEDAKQSGGATTEEGDSPVAGSIAAQEEEVKRLTELWKNATEELRDGYKKQLEEAQAVLDEMTGKTKKAAEPQDTGASFNGHDMSTFEKLQQSIRIKLADQNFEVDQNSLTNLMTVAIQNGITGMDGAFEGLQYQLAEGLGIPDSAWEELTAQINEHLANLGLDPIELDVKTGNVKAASEAAVSNAKSTADAWQNAVAAVNNVGSALQQIEDPAAKVAGIVMQAVANIALGFAQATASPATGAAGVFGWIAAATAGLATMVSTIASIKSVTKGYASGGIVEGTSYSGDNIVARLNAGEGVLTAQGVQNAAAMANNSNPLGNLALSMDLKGEDIQICLDNNRMRRGR